MKTQTGRCMCRSSRLCPRGTPGASPSSILAEEDPTIVALQEQHPEQVGSHEVELTRINVEGCSANAYLSLLQSFPASKLSASAYRSSSSLRWGEQSRVPIQRVDAIVDEAGLRTARVSPSRYGSMRSHGPLLAEDPAAHERRSVRIDEPREPREPGGGVRHQVVARATRTTSPRHLTRQNPSRDVLANLFSYLRTAVAGLP